MSVYKRRGSWFCDITIDGRRVQRVLKKARTRAQAIKAESVIQNKLFENKYKVEKRPEVRFDKFVKDHFLPYSKLHKKTYPDDVLVCNMLFETFGSLSLTEITAPMIEKFKQKRLEGKTFYKRKRNPATVNRELCVLSKIFSLAFDAEFIDSNPCRRVRKFRTDTRRTRYLTFEEEARLFEKLESQEWVQRIVMMAINTGMRQGEIFDLTWFDVDLPRGVIHIRVSKNGKDRFVPINQTVRTNIGGHPPIFSSMPN
jgi:integrase